MRCFLLPKARKNKRGMEKRMVENQDFISAEDLKVRNLLKNHNLAKAIADASWKKYLTMLRYKG